MHYQQPFSMTSNQFVQEILSGNRAVLSKAITLVESSLEEHQKIAQKIIAQCLPYSGKSIRIGITGVPGVGKSTFIDALGKYITSQGKKLAVLAIDPSSQVSGGSILGDKTRMEELSVDENAFIRPSPSSGSLGGVARSTRETIILCEAAGFEIIFVETVGVGQSETDVHKLVDFFLLLMLAGAGDELQGIKRGIMEMADAIIINKADGDNITKAKAARSQYAMALHLFPPTDSGWIPKVEICSALTKDGIDRAWKIVEEHHSLVQSKGFFQKKRQEQSKFWMYETIDNDLKNLFYRNENISKLLPQLEKNVMEGKISSFAGASMLITEFQKK